MTVQCAFCGRQIDRENATFVGDLAHCPECIPGTDDSETDEEELNQQTAPDDGETLVNTQPSRDDCVLEIEPSVFPEDLLDIEQWHAWKETTDGRKVPRAPYEYPEWPDKFVSAQDAEVWTNFDTVQEWVDKLSGYGLAFNIRDREEYPDEQYVLIDYDDVRDPETDEIHPVVRDHLERAGSYADVSTSGTGVHIFARGTLPEDVKAIDADLPEDPDFPDAEIEVYDSARYSAMTGDHLAGTPRETTDCQAFLEDLAEQFATVAEGTPDELTREPEKSREEIEDVDATSDIQDVLDAIQHTGPGDVRLRSTVTQERGDGSKSLDPYWANSESGTRLAEVGDGWVYRKGMHGLDALQVVALEERIITSEDEYPEGEEFWKAVDALRERGAHIPEYEPAERDTEPTVVLPAAHRDLTTAASGWDWKHAARESEDTLTVDDARGRTKDAIADAYRSGDHVLIEALPTTGKSYGSILAAAETDRQITILTGRGNKEQYDQLREWCEEHGLDYYTLPSFKRDCDTANGEHGDEWADRVNDWYDRGATPKTIHKNAEYELGRPLPCQEHEGQRCPYASKWDFDPDDYDVLIGHYSHAYKSKVTGGRVCVFDEFPGASYETTLSRLLQGAVSYWLTSTDGIPFEDYTDLIENRDDEERRADALLWFEENDPEPDETHVFNDSAAHASAPLAVFTLLAGEDLGNGVEVADLGDLGTGVFYRETGQVTILQPPALDYASGVVALDGTPTLEMWEDALGQRLNHRQVLQDGDRAEYILNALNENFVLTTEAIKPYNSADYVNPEQDAALLERIADKHGERPSVITSSTAETEYGEAVLKHVDETKHYGNILGSNEFDDVRVGAVIGSNHYGDRYIKKWAAYHGEAVDRNDGKGADLSYGEFGDKILTHMREHDTLQAAMRFGRDGNGAVVYVHTNTLPDWVPIAGEGRVLSTWSDGQRQVLAAIEDLQEWRTPEIADHPAVDVGERRVRQILNEFAERGVLSREWDGQGYIWSDDGLHELNEHGAVELDPVDLNADNAPEEAEISRSTIYTWNFRGSPDHTDAPPDQDGEPSSNRPGRPSNQGDPASISDD